MCWPCFLYSRYPAASWAAAPAAKVYVILWFDTEDYLLPADDDAALHLADFLTHEDIRATFKVVGEKARTLERRKRDDVIDALKRHEIGFHSNWHSVQPSPAMYLSTLGWDEGVAEFDRREGPGRDDVERIFGQAPTCYGQPGSSWGPQSYGAMKKWGMGVYLDAGKHIGLDGKPCYYGGALNLYNLDHILRTNLTSLKEEQAAEDRFTEARKALLAEGGGIVSIYYHPCEFVHKEFWDGVNFQQGANPPREQWKLPAQKSAEETKTAYETFETWIRFIKRFPEVRFITASEAAKLYRDGRAAALMPRTTSRRWRRESATRSAFSGKRAIRCRRRRCLPCSTSMWRIGPPAGRRSALTLNDTPFGPTSDSPLMPADGVVTDWSQFGRTAGDVVDFVRKQHRIPGTVWLGSKPVSPEAYLKALAPIALDLLDGKQPPDEITLKPATLKAADYVSADDPKLWGWVIFPPDFKAPAMMQLAKRQAWTLKPALLQPAGE